MFPNASGTALDLDGVAIERTSANCLRNGVPVERLKMIQGDWNDIADYYDLIVWNPPYVDSVSVEKILFEPRGALDGGKDGLDSYRNAKFLDKAKFLAVEIGEGQLEQVKEIIGKEVFHIEQDMQKIDRVVVFKN